MHAHQIILLAAAAVACNAAVIGRRVPITPDSAVKREDGNVGAALYAAFNDANVYGHASPYIKEAGEKVKREDGNVGTALYGAFNDESVYGHSSPYIKEAGEKVKRAEGNVGTALYNFLADATYGKLTPNIKEAGEKVKRAEEKRAEE